MILNSCHCCLIIVIISILDCGQKIIYVYIEYNNNNNNNNNSICVAP